MKKILNCKGLACPMPVIMTKKELERSDIKEVQVMVDNVTAKENLKKLGQSMSIEPTVQEENGNFILCFNKEEAEVPVVTQEAELKTLQSSKGQEVLLITSEFLGKGNDELGKILMKGFIYTLSETQPYPAKILFLNSGVKLTSENEEAIKNLKKLMDQGVEILSCGTCIDFYQLKDKLQVGKVANMYDIVEAMKAAENKWVV